MTKTHAPPSVQAAPHRSTLLPFAAGAPAFGVSCGLPLLVSLGSAAAVARLDAGNWIVVYVASVVAVLGVLCWGGQRSGDFRLEETDPTSMRRSAEGGAADGWEKGR